MPQPLETRRHGRQRYFPNQPWTIVPLALGLAVHEELIGAPPLRAGGRAGCRRIEGWSNPALPRSLGHRADTGGARRHGRAAPSACRWHRQSQCPGGTRRCDPLSSSGL